MGLDYRRDVRAAVLRFSAIIFLVFLFGVRCTSIHSSLVLKKETQAPGVPTSTVSNDGSKVLALSWETEGGGNRLWSDDLRANIGRDLKSYSSAKDRLEYCASYDSLSDSDKINVWATMAVAIAKFESNYKPTSVYHEPAPLLIDSVGLFQLSYEDNMSWCTKNKMTHDLEKPLVNIDCALGEMRKLIDRDGVIAKYQGGDSLGLARYWSTIREGSTHFKKQIMTETNRLSFCKVAK